MYIIKKAILDSEKQKVKAFLETKGLKYENDITETYYIDGVIATVSLANNIIKCLAVDDTYANENLASQLIDYVIKEMQARGIYHLLVYTKAEYEAVFNSMNFKTIVKTDKVSFMEFGDPDINDAIVKIKNQVQNQFQADLSLLDIGAVVANCNPITDGHLSLIEMASKLHDVVILFLVEEDNSMFTFQERLTLAYLATKPLCNVIVVPSTNYIVSKLTFPGYFLKSPEEKEMQYSKVDAMIFEKHFMPMLNINKRYIGTETKDYMCAYNRVLKEVLQEKVVEVERYKRDETTISASLVRKLIKESKISEAVEYVPIATKAIFQMIARSKRW